MVLAPNLASPGNRSPSQRRFCRPHDLQQFAGWVESQMSFDQGAEAYAELEARGLTR
jgi:hypothetical protein